MHQRLLLTYIFNQKLVQFLAQVPFSPIPYGVPINFFSVAVPPNDRCIDSVTLEMGEKVDGDNTFANFDYNNQGVCGSRSDRRAVWYEINGSGKEVTVNVCTNNEQITDFGIFRACNTQNCLGGPPQQMIVTKCDDDESNEYVFFGNEGESYYIHVRSDVVFTGVGTMVGFALYSIHSLATRI